MSEDQNGPENAPHEPSPDDEAAPVSEPGQVPDAADEDAAPERPAYPEHAESPAPSRGRRPPSRLARVVAAAVGLVLVGLAAALTSFALRGEWDELRRLFLGPEEEQQEQDPGAAPQTPPVQLQTTCTHQAMGTEFAFTLYAREGDAGTGAVQHVAEQAFAAIDALEARVSRWEPTSQTAYINNHAAEKPVRVAPDICQLIVHSREFYDETDGAFDITVGPLIALWGFYKGEGRLPTDEELAEALALVGMDKVSIDEEDRRIGFEKEGMQLDFGGIAKGLALDYAADVLRDYGVSAAVLHAGTSTVLAIGAPPGEPGWTVRVRDPYNANGYIDEVVLKEECLSTSGSYERFFELDGKKYCHIFDPRTGRPVEGVVSATAIGPNGMVTDALSTAFFVMGDADVEAYCLRHPEIRAILVPVSPSGEPQARRVNFPAGKEIS